MTGDDELRRRLSGLAADLDGVSLPGPSAARRRGTRRTRQEVAGGVLAGVAAVAGGVAIINPQGFMTTPDPAPPASQSSPAPSDPTLATMPTLSTALLTAEDVAGNTRTAWAATDDPGPQVACDPADTIDIMSSLLDRAEIAFASEAGTVRQDLVRFVDGVSVGGVRDEFFECLPERGAEGTPWVSDAVRLGGIGDEGWMARYYADPADQQATVVTVAIVRSRDVVSVTVQTTTTANTVGATELDLGIPVAAAERMCDVLFGETCVTDPFTEELDSGDPTSDPSAPSPDPTEPAGPTTPATQLLDLAEDPFLTDGDVTTIGIYTGFTRRPDYEDVESLAERCLDELPAAGADPFVTMHYATELEGMLAEYVLRLPDEGSAFRVIAGHTNSPDVCGEVGEQRTETVSEATAVEVAGADDALTWTIDNQPTPDNPGSSGSFTGNGMARAGNIVVVVSFTAMGDPSDGDWSGVAAGLLATALERAVG